MVSKQLQAVESLPFDMVFMDMQMPEMDGLEATSRIRELKGPISSILIVAMTANAMQEHKDQCLNAGMNAFISKPVNLDKLIGFFDEHFA